MYRHHITVYMFVCIILQPKRTTHSQIARCSPSIIHVYCADTIDAHCNTRDEIWRHSEACG
jgi:hypothetical protein